MPMESPASSPLTALAHSSGKPVAAAQIADAMVSTWLEIDAALRPIIGQGGVAALYKRSLYLSAQAHPWLGSTQEGVQAPMDLAALKVVIAEQTNANAAAGSRALLHTFNELLTSLVGPSLTERLLRSVWANSFSGSPAQDSSP
ncbi:MAG: hypothetical protein JWN23_3114 [Rhodocyclales bacterium]|nr:hypothetical protein [Rhodocyclales bacterium]